MNDDWGETGEERAVDRDSSDAPCKGRVQTKLQRRRNTFIRNEMARFGNRWPTGQNVPSGNSCRPQLGPFCRRWSPERGAGRPDPRVEAAGAMVSHGAAGWLVSPAC